MKKTDKAKIMKWLGVTRFSPKNWDDLQSLLGKLGQAHMAYNPDTDKWEVWKDVAAPSYYSEHLGDALCEMALAFLESRKVSNG